MDTYNISDAKANLSAIIEKIVAEGEDVIISKAGRPVARVTRYEAAKTKRRLNLFKGKVKMAKDFDQWPADIARSLSIID